MSKIQVKKIAQLTGHNASIFALSAGKDVQHFRSGAGEGWVAEWNLADPENGQLITKIDSQIFSLCPIFEKEELLVGNMNGGLHWVNLDNVDSTKNIAHHKKGIFAIQRIGDKIITAGGGGLLTKWSISKRRTLESIELSNSSLRSLAYSENRNEIAVGASDSAIYFLDADTLKVKYTIQNAHQNSVFSLVYHPDNERFISGGRDAHLNIWNLNNFEKIDSKPAHWFTINDIVFNPPGTLFATASRDKTIKIWDAKTFELLKVLETIRDKGHLNSVNTLYWSDYNNYLISGSDDRSIIVWNIKS